MLVDSKESLSFELEKIFTDLYELDSIIEFTKNACTLKENSAEYYNLKDKIGLSTERNHYINMLTIASEKILNLLESNKKIEAQLTDLKQNANNRS